MEKEKTAEKLMNITVGDMLSNIAKKYPTKLAVKYIEVNYTRTYYEFNKEVDKYAKGLLGMGICKGDHVAIWATNYPEWLVLFFATARIGAVLVTVNTNYKEAELEYLLSNSDSKALFICDGIKDIDCEKIIYSVCPELKTSKPGELRNERLPFLRYVVSLDNWYDGMYNWSQIPYLGVLVSNDEYNALKHSIDPDDVVNMQYTSGTTGFPKGVMLTHNNIVNNGKAIGDCMKFTAKDKLCIPVPFFHCFGLVLAIMASVTHCTSMVPVDRYNPLKVMQAMLDTRQPLSKLCEPVTIYPQVLKNVVVDDKDGTLADSAVTAAVAAEEARLGDRGRVLLRKSGTEPLLRVMAEAETDDECERSVDAIIDAMRTSGHLVGVK